MFTAGLDGALLAGAIAALAASALLPAAAMAFAAAPSLLRGSAPRALGVLGGLLAAAAAARVLAGADPAPLAWWPGFPTQPFGFGLDALSAPFLLLIGSIAALSFAAHAPQGRFAPIRLSLHAAFVLALLVATVARHGVLFLLAWEGMTLLSAALVASDPASARARRATYVYLALSQAGAALIAFALLSLGARGGWSFEAMSLAFAALPAAEANVLAWCLTAGFAVKLGLVPLQGWLPLAHPEAPAPVSALLSGAMVNLGLYGLLRFAWSLPGSPPEGWGVLLLLAGVATALVGALFAAVESDAKRLLAWSTVKHSGLLAMAVGLAALLQAASQLELARLAMAAALVHALGHGLAKAAAFLAVGEAAHAVGTRDLEQWDGLARRMPRTGLAAILAVAALAGLPALSCFAGEWLLLQALLHGYSAGAGQLRLLAPFAVAGLALATALSLAACAKLIGIGFLGRARTERANTARDPGAVVGGALLAASALPVAAGLLAPQLIGVVARPLAMLLPGAELPLLTAHAGLTLSFAGAGASPVGAVLMVALFSALAMLLTRGGSKRPGVRRAPSWTCGTPIKPRGQYSSAAFARPIRLLFAPILRAAEDRSAVELGTRYAPRRMHVHAGAPRVLEGALVAPLVQAVLFVSEQARRLQSGQLHVYLAYLLVTLVALLIWGRG